MAPHGEFRWFKVSVKSTETVGNSWTKNLPWPTLPLCRRHFLQPEWHVDVLNLQSSGAVWIGRWWAWVLIPYPILPLSLISRTVSVDVKHHEWRRKLILSKIQVRFGCVALCPRMSADVLGTSRDQRRSMVQYNFTSTETRRLVRTGSPGRPPRLSYSSWTMTKIQGSLLSSVFVLTTVWYCVDCVVECTMFWVWFSIQMIVTCLNERVPLRSWKVLLRVSQPITPLLCLVLKTWRPLFWGFAQNIKCDILIGWSVRMTGSPDFDWLKCSDDWQPIFWLAEVLGWWQPRTLW